MAAIPLEQEAAMTARASWLRSRAATIAIAREDPVTFCAFVLRDELTGEPIAMMPMHERMHDAVTKYDRVVMWAHFESGKTTQLSIGRVLWELGKNPNLRVAIVSRAAKGAKKIIRAIAGYIERSRELREVFPELVRSRDSESVWSSEALTVKRDVISKDPSVQACGYHGQIVGSRIDLLIVDDLLDAETTATPEQRENVTKWVESSLFTRITADARVVIVGNAWHDDDTMHKAVDEKGFASLRFPVYDPENDNAIAWPGKWTEKRIAQSRRDLGAIEFARKMLCISRNDEMQRFKQAWIDIACEAGVGFELVQRIDDPAGVPNGYIVITGVDLSTGEGKDRSTFVTVMLHPDGRAQILNVESHRITGPEIVDKIDELHDRYGGIVIVENNGSQQFILQFSKKLTNAIVWSYTTGKNKADPIFGVEGIAVELQRGDWIIPCEIADQPGGNVAKKGEKRKRFDLHPEIDALVREMLFYDPRKHTGDRLMGLFFAREACVKFRAMRKRGQQGLGSSLTVIGGDGKVDPKAAGSTAPGRMRRAVGA